MNTANQKEVSEGRLDIVPADRNKSLQEISRLQAEAGDLRRQRINAEDEILAHSPEQRKNNVLDYIRRGHLKDKTVYIMPEIIQAAPALLDSGIIDFAFPDYDEKTVIQYILKVCNEIESEVTGEDKIVRDLLQDRFKLTVKTKKYLSETWYKSEFMGLLADYQKKTKTKIHESSPFFGKPEEFKADLRKKTVEKMSKILEGNTEDVLNNYESDPGKFVLKVSEKKSDDKVKQFLLSKNKDGFSIYPKLSEYKGPIVESPPSLKNQRANKGILIVERDQIPDIKGGVIIDGNFGYDKDGNIIRPEDKIIIDHHDKLDQKKYDTATIMVGRFWRDKDRFGDLSAKEGITKDKIRLIRQTQKGSDRLVTMVNHLDSDSILSLWAFRNPKRTAQYKSIMDKISQCGDFLTGSGILEYGATARDYEYIIRNYIRACQENVKNERVEDDVKKLAEKENALKKLTDERQKLDSDLKAILDNDEEIKAFNEALTEIKKSQIPPNEKGKAIGLKTKERDALIFRKYGDKSAKLKDLEKTQKLGEEEIKKLKKEIDDKKGKKISSEESAKVATHILETMEDIIKTPFKYQKFFLEERKKENETIDQVTEWYKNGDVEIMPYSKDNGMILLMGLKKKEFPRVENIDGQYFFLRKRKDFNQPIVVTVGQDAFVVGINTQDARVFDKYEFNKLIDHLKKLEDEISNDLLMKKEKELEELPHEAVKKRENLNKEISGLRAHIEKNNSGRNWRNRTQLVFCFKSHIPHDTFLEAVREWKGEQDRVYDDKKKLKN